MLKLIGEPNVFTISELFSCRNLVDGKLNCTQLKLVIDLSQFEPGLKVQK